MPKCHCQHTGSLRSAKELSESYASYQYCRHRGIVHTSSRFDIENALRRNCRLGLQRLYIQPLKAVDRIVPLVSVETFWGNAVSEPRRLRAYSRKAHIGANTSVPFIIFGFQTPIHSCRLLEQTSWCSAPTIPPALRINVSKSLRSGVEFWRPPLDLNITCNYWCKQIRFSPSPRD